ncbi:hypothetical protein [Blackfly microvirus SF02]|uniref:Uncharacterized protein n=1 Tax=Blackfly microvirus SF02 TaxID=2576452 RepID=A0A4P8PTM9_9VIRU|nr:hypothetical protein [Blackfly microvirus SF02]
MSKPYRRQPCVGIRWATPNQRNTSPAMQLGFIQRTSLLALCAVASACDVLSSSESLPLTSGDHNLQPSTRSCRGVFVYCPMFQLQRVQSGPGPRVRDAVQPRS